MALVVKDRVKETTTTTGTGTINLAGAASGFQSFVSGVGDGNTTYYAITDANGAWEVGLGTVTDGSPDTLARTTVLATSNGDTSQIESFENCIPSNSVAKIDHMVHHRRKAFVLFVRNLGIGGCQDNLPNSLKRNSIVPLI